jgi:hypothetical protein
MRDPNRLNEQYATDHALRFVNRRTPYTARA